MVKDDEKWDSEPNHLSVLSSACHWISSHSCSRFLFCVIKVRVLFNLLCVLILFQNASSLFSFLQHMNIVVFVCVSNIKKTTIKVQYYVYTLNRALHFENTFISCKPGMHEIMKFHAGFIRVSQICRTCLFWIMILAFQVCRPHSERDIRHFQIHWQPSPDWWKEIWSASLCSGHIVPSSQVLHVGDTFVFLHAADVCGTVL